MPYASLTLEVKEEIGNNVMADNIWQVREEFKISMKMFPYTSMGTKWVRKVLNSHTMKKDFDKIKQIKTIKITMESKKIRFFSVLTSRAVCAILKNEKCHPLFLLFSSL